MNTQTNTRSRSGSTSGRRRTFSSSKPRTQSDRFKSGAKPTGNRSYSGGAGRSRGGSRNGGGRGGKKMPSFDPSQFINTNPVDVAEEVYVPKHTFATFGLDERLVKIILSAGMTTPTPIQDQIIPDVKNGKDVIGMAETGTGKTAAFLIPIIENTLKDMDRKTLILAPTRELALQIQEELKKLSVGFGMHSTICVGGMSIRPQIMSLKRANHFIIGTPGRIKDLMNRKLLPIAQIKTVVLDEADRMLDMGFIGDMRTILAATPKERETLFFSATMSNTIRSLVSEFLRDPVIVSVKKKDVTNSIAQDVVMHDHNNKFHTLLELLKQPEFKRVIIFGSMKHSVEKLAQELSANSIKATSIHGNKNHSQRQLALQRFKRGETQILVATDVAARGIHVEDVTHVINYDLPNTFEDYVHRIGRTGRGSKKGKAFTFIPKG